MLISPEYKALQIQTHIDKPDWGIASIAFADNIKKACEHYGEKSVLDYGCGKQHLKRLLAPYGIEVIGYDPGIPGLDNAPSPHNFVACIDVLEHIEPECVDDVIKDLRRVTRKVGLFTICTVQASTWLADGSNAHRTIQPAKWWLDKLSRYFNITVLNENSVHFAVAVTPI